MLAIARIRTLRFISVIFTIICNHISCQIKNSQPRLGNFLCLSTHFSVLLVADQAEWSKKYTHISFPYNYEIIFHIINYYWSSNKLIQANNPSCLIIKLQFSFTHYSGAKFVIFAELRLRQQ